MGEQTGGGVGNATERLSWGNELVAGLTAKRFVSPVVQTSGSPLSDLSLFIGIYRRKPAPPGTLQICCFKYQEEYVPPTPNIRRVFSPLGAPARENRSLDLQWVTKTSLHKNTLTSRPGSVFRRVKSCEVVAPKEPSSVIDLIDLDQSGRFVFALLHLQLQQVKLVILFPLPVR